MVLNETISDYARMQLFLMLGTLAYASDYVFFLSRKMCCFHAAFRRKAMIGNTCFFACTKQAMLKNFDEEKFEI